MQKPGQARTPLPVPRRCADRRRAPRLAPPAWDDRARAADATPRRPRPEGVPQRCAERLRSTDYGATPRLGGHDGQRLFRVRTSHPMNRTKRVERASIRSGRQQMFGMTRGQLKRSLCVKQAAIAGESVDDPLGAFGPGEGPEVVAPMARAKAYPQMRIGPSTPATPPPTSTATAAPRPSSNAPIPSSEPPTFGPDDPPAPSPARTANCPGDRGAPPHGASSGPYTDYLAKAERIGYAPMHGWS